MKATARLLIGSIDHVIQEVTMRVARIVLLLCALGLCVGCSAFRWGERSYQEVEELNQQQREADRVMFKNDEVLSEK